MTKTLTKPSNTDTTTDDRVRHYVKRLTPNGVVPAQYSKFALCGAEIKELLTDHNGKICQKCIEESRKVKRED